MTFLAVIFQAQNKSRDLAMNKADIVIIQSRRDLKAKMYLQEHRLNSSLERLFFSSEVF